MSAWGILLSITITTITLYRVFTFIRVLIQLSLTTVIRLLLMYLLFVLKVLMVYSILIIIKLLISCSWFWNNNKLNRFNFATFQGWQQTKKYFNWFKSPLIFQNIKLKKKFLFLPFYTAGNSTNLRFLLGLQKIEVQASLLIIWHFSHT